MVELITIFFLMCYPSASDIDVENNSRITLATTQSKCEAMATYINDGGEMYCYCIEEGK